jgi:hypothetical protein
VSAASGSPIDPYAAAAARASGEPPEAPSSNNAARNAPAPHRSSTAGRSSPSGAHRSPAAIASTVPSSPARSRTQEAAARALRRLTATTSQPNPASASAIVDPFGDGSTTRRRSVVVRKVTGDRLTWPGPACDRPTASAAS